MKPKRIILVRHGQSEGNVDKNIYRIKPDYALSLTNLGIQQAIEAGKLLSKILKNDSYCVNYSPFYRARKTMDIALSEIINKPKFIREEVRIREQEWGGGYQKNDTNEIEKERDKYGPFFYRIGNGESCADCFDRISDYIGSLHRDFLKKDYPNNLVIFAHGMINRIFLMRWLHATVEEFQTWANPKNGEVIILELQYNNKYKLKESLRKHKVLTKYKYK